MAQLPRLPREWYQGDAFVFWTYTIRDRKTGWLTASFHTTFREILLHTLIRYRLAAPVYCLMPDHVHWIGIGLDRRSDQLTATSFLRKFLCSHLKPAQWQRQAYDHILREEERLHDAFSSTCHYILENPVRAGLVPHSKQWPFSGGLTPGYPDFSPFDQDYWPRFWKALENLRGEK